MRELVWLDLCSGLGGASQPALDRGWRVIRVDIDARFKPDIVADVRYLPLKPFHVDVLWASPPCQEFSKHGMMKTFYPNAPQPDLSIVRAVCEVIGALRPDYWMLENVSGARRFISPILGDPVRSGGHLIWGRLPCLLPSPSRTRKGGDFKDRKARTNRVIAECGPVPDGWPRSHYKTLAALCAKIPYEIGEAICAAVERRVEEE